MSDHVLVAVDDSDPAWEALAFALADQPEARVTALHVTDPADVRSGATIEGDGGGGMPAYGDLQRSRETQNRRAENVLETARRRAADAGREIETAHVVGDAASTVVDYAEERDIDRIVLGSHGRTGAARILLGSVAETVARRSPVPVTIVR